ncbi:aldose 1-epimerase family protein [Rapidithrix thailandica]|uniref:Aldose 1-epimerase family protein n=1 Tax=Rapidithrix thailandica TaxID=413964 RepID=A0AAW9S4R1_9BACT
MEKVTSLQNEYLQIKVNAKGAELTSLFSPKSQLEYLWQADSTYWGRHAPVLFPIVGRLADDRFQVRQTSHQLSQHGFARDMPFELIDRSDEHLTFELLNNVDTIEKYPYIFSLQISYRLKGKTLEIVYRVENRDDKTIYFSIGAHPAFNCPILPDTKKEEYQLTFEKKETAHQYFLQEGLIAGKEENFLNETSRLPLHKGLFAKDALIFKDLVSKKITLTHQNGEHILSLHFPGFPYFGIWSKSEEAPFVCLEPWFGIADTQGVTLDFIEKEGIQSLERSEEFLATYSIVIENI